jgi:hypothetical protein
MSMLTRRLLTPNIWPISPIATTGGCGSMPGCYATRIVTL